MRPTDQETAALERSFVTHSSQEGAHDARQGHMGRRQGGWRQREGGSVQTRDLTEVSAEGVDKAGWAAEDWLVWIVPAGSGVQGPSRVVWYGWLLVNDVKFVISKEDLASGPGTRHEHSRAAQSFIKVRKRTGKASDADSEGD